MTLIADILLIAGALGVAFYCFVLSRRLSRFTDLERGVGGAVAVLSVQVDELTRALERARAAAEGSSADLSDLTQRAEAVTKRLELQVAALHEEPDAEETPVASATAPGTDDAPADPPTPLQSMRGSVGPTKIFSRAVGGTR